MLNRETVECNHYIIPIKFRSDTTALLSNLVIFRKSSKLWGKMQTELFNSYINIMITDQNVAVFDQN